MKGSWRVGVVGVLGSPLVRALAWSALVGATGLLVRGEAVRPELPAGVRLSADLAYAGDDGRRGRLDVYTPDAPVPPGGRPAVVALHGGGWRGGSKSDYGRSLAELATPRNGLVVVAADYRLSRPGAPSWPGNVGDVRAAVAWVRRHAAELGVDPGRIALMGSSAGGHLALTAAFGGGDAVTAGGDPRRSSGDASAVRAVIDLYGPTDLAGLPAGSAARNAAELMLTGRADSPPARLTAASPLDLVRSGVPAVLILHGDDDRLIPPGQSLDLADALVRADVYHRIEIVAGARHGFGLRVGTRDFVPDVLAFLSKVWKD